jgi:N-acetylmuramoyl-L-alanine amidase
MTFRIAIDPGHGGEDHGAEYGGFIESEMNLKVAIAVEKSLYGTGYETQLTRTTDQSISLAERNAQLKSWQPHFVASIHHNANPSPVTNGFECYYHPGNSKTRLISIHAAEHAPLPLRSGKVFDTNAEGHKRKWRQRPKKVVSAFGAPCVLFECGYLTNPHDLEYLKLRRSVQAIATTIRASIVRASDILGLGGHYG